MPRPLGAALVYLLPSTYYLLYDIRMTDLGFWKKLKKPLDGTRGEPIMVLAPMADVTDCAFRALIAKYSKWEGNVPEFDKVGLARTNFLYPKILGGLDVMWTEFVSADGLCRANEVGKKKLLKDLEYTEAERPIVAQLFGSKPEYMEEAARLCQALGFDGIDINMGCPDKSIEKQGAGAAMIKNPALAREIIRAAKRGAPNLPISVKTRVGFNKVELEEWLPELLAEDLAVVTIHARTRKEMSKVPANWQHVKRAVEIRDEFFKNLPHRQVGLPADEARTLIFGNGDVLDLEDARAKARATGCDGIMLGRAIFGNPFLFAKKENLPTINLKLKTLLEHTKLFEEKLGQIKNFAIMKKHFKAYVKDFPEASELREKLMQTLNAREVEEVIHSYIISHLDNKIKEE